MRAHGWLVAAVVGLVAVSGVSGARGAGPAPRHPDGRGLFLRECAGCHGPDARGDGPDASIFSVPPRNLRDPALRAYTDEALVATIRRGEALPLALDPARVTERTGQVEDLIAHLERLPTIDWRSVERGEEIYVDRCELCHGPSGEPPRDVPGTGGHRPQDLSAPVFQRSIDDRTLLAAVQHGRGGMPAIPALRRDDDARMLVAYVRLLSPGARLYSRFCASCHGDDGRADELVDPARGPRVVFDRDYFRKTDPEVLRTKVWHMLAVQRPAMPHFRSTLTDADAHAIVAWLRKAP
jgi:mono/diheme cytochrome c family protein